MARFKRVVVFWVGAVAVLLVLVLLSHYFGVGIPCPLYSLTGLYCPGCGTMRSITALAHFDAPAAFGQNALFVLFLPVLAAMLVWETVRYVKGTPLKSTRRGLVATMAFAVCFTAFGILRNLPAFSFLAPF